MFVKCEHGHQIELPATFELPKDVIAAISWCIVPVGNGKCGGKVVCRT